MHDAPELPPLLSSRECDDPFSAACRAARSGCAPGLLCWGRGGGALSAALVLAPEEPLERAAAMVAGAGLSLAAALVGVGPAQIVPRIEDGVLRLSGAACGRLRAAAPGCALGDVPDWLVVGFDVDLAPETDAEPGHDPDRTTLLDEGFGALAPADVLEPFARAVLARIDAFEAHGAAAFADAWSQVSADDPLDLIERARAD